MTTPRRSEREKKRRFAGSPQRFAWRTQWNGYREAESQRVTEPAFFEELRANQIDLVLVAGARPNFVKLAPLHHALEPYSALRKTIVHTGQHYDEAMSDVFFRELGIPSPEINLEVGPGTHAEQTAGVMVGFERVVQRLRPRCVVLFGDINSTVACALVAAKLGVPVAHVEAGLRSNDWSMPEEVNRVVTDRLSSRLYTPSRDAGENLAREGIAPDRVRFVGNIMVDTLLAQLPSIDRAVSCSSPHSAPTARTAT